MRTRTTLTVMRTTLAVTIGLLGWQLYSAHQLRQDIDALQQGLARAAVQTPAPIPALPGNLNPLAQNQITPTPSAPAPTSPLQAAPNSAPVNPPGAIDPFAGFFSGTGDPFADFDQMRQRMEQLMSGQGDSFFDDFSGGAFTGTAQPEINLDEKPDAYVVTIDLPDGSSNVEVSTAVENGQLNIEGKLTMKQEDAQRGRSITSVQTQEFARSLPLPADADPLGIRNETQGNQVIVTLPKHTG